jgi:uncharacterized protein YqhQ
LVYIWIIQGIGNLNKILEVFGANKAQYQTFEQKIDQNDENEMLWQYLSF